MAQDFCTILQVCIRFLACLLRFKGNVFKSQLDSVEKSDHSACVHFVARKSKGMTHFGCWEAAAPSELTLYQLSIVLCVAVSGGCSQKVNELDTINSPQTSIATFVYLSFLSILALQPSLRLALHSPSLPSPLTSCSPPLHYTPQVSEDKSPTTPPLLVPQVNQRHPRNTLAKRDPASPYGLAQKSSF